MDDRAKQHRQRHRSHDRATILLIIGVLLLMPPLAGIFNLESRIAGIPLTLVYLFSVWAVLIVGTALLSRRLGRGDGDDDGDGEAQ